LRGKCHSKPRTFRNFIDIREKERDPRRDQDQGRSLMNRRNNEAGRKILKRHTAPKCKCHGVSGACNLKTCWMQLPTMRQVGNILQNKYKSAIRVQVSCSCSATVVEGRIAQALLQVNSRGNLQLVADQLSKASGGKRKTRALPTDLVYMDDSPDYCRQDRATGTLGTHGRVCRRGTDGPDGCDSLCCGRGYNTYTVEQTTKCNCKFEWCCKVVCEMCTNTTQVDICK
uniref:Protein Wnt n=1 Tax=Heligmosomoides polygyrus TaxID=6339 RepID=A0A183GUC7_HELPZ